VSSSAAGTLSRSILPAYTDDAGRYDDRTRAFQQYRELIVDALDPRPGEVVVDVGCGTGLCFAALVARVGPRGTVIGVDQAPDMVAVARRRVTEAGWRNVVVVESPIASAEVDVPADAALFSAVHDILQSGEALRTVIGWLRPGARVAAGGGKWASPWLPMLNAQIRSLHAPYVADFGGFDRPWSRLDRLLQNFQMREVAFGTGYVATGRVG